MSETINIIVEEEVTEVVHVNEGQRGPAGEVSQAQLDALTMAQVKGVGCKVRQTTPQTMPDVADTTLEWHEAVYDPLGMLNPLDNRQLIIPTGFSGVWFFVLQIGFEPLNATGGSGGRRSGGIAASVTGHIGHFNREATQSGGVRRLQTVAPALVNEDEIVTGASFQNSEDDLDTSVVQASGTYFAAHFLGPLIVP